MFNYLFIKMTGGLQHVTDNPDVPKLYIQETLEAFRQGAVVRLMMLRCLPGPRDLH